MFSGIVTSTAKKNVLQRCMGSVAHRAKNIFSLQSLLALLLDLGDCREADVCELGMVAHACNPNLPGDWAGRISWAQEFRASLGNIVRSILKQNKTSKQTTPNPMVLFLPHA
jgi:hypothetical protein